MLSSIKSSSGSSGRISAIIPDFITFRTRRIWSLYCLIWSDNIVKLVCDLLHYDLGTWLSVAIGVVALVPNIKQIVSIDLKKLRYGFKKNED